ncbi:MAG: GDSL-type esterase/lipase family protein [Methylovirgula sp.]
MVSPRLDAASRDNPDGVILELGANDMLRGLDPSQTRQTLDRILAKLSERHIKVLVHWRACATLPKWRI